jgi:hypothetical protein
MGSRSIAIVARAAPIDNAFLSSRVVMRTLLGAGLGTKPRRTAGMSIASASSMRLAMRVRALVVILEDGIGGADDRGYVYIEYLTVLATVGIVSALALFALLPNVYDYFFDNVGIVLSMKP